MRPLRHQRLRRAQPRPGATGARRPLGGSRTAHGDLLGRDEAAAGSRQRARALARCPLPRWARLHRRDRAPVGEPPDPRGGDRARTAVAGRRVPARHRQAPGGRAGAGGMTEILLLGRRAVREVVRLPAATVPTLFIPVFFLAVNIGQVSKTFPSTTSFLHGQGYVGFQLPVSLIFALCTTTSGFALVTEIDLGYF